MEGTILRLNALLQLTPFKVVEECCEFEWYISSNHTIFKIFSPGDSPSFQDRLLGWNTEKVRTIHITNFRREYVH